MKNKNLSVFDNQKINPDLIFVASDEINSTSNKIVFFWLRDFEGWKYQPVAFIIKLSPIPFYR